VATLDSSNLEFEHFDDNDYVSCSIDVEGADLVLVLSPAKKKRIKKRIIFYKDYTEISLNERVSLRINKQIELEVGKKVSTFFLSLNNEQHTLTIDTKELEEHL